jgi:hypothetical protein
MVCSPTAGRLPAALSETADARKCADSLAREKLQVRHEELLIAWALPFPATTGRRSTSDSQTIAAMYTLVSEGGISDVELSPVFVFAGTLQQPDSCDSGRVCTCWGCWTCRLPRCTVASLRYRTCLGSEFGDRVGIVKKVTVGDHSLPSWRNKITWCLSYLLCTYCVHVHTCSPPS